MWGKKKWTVMSSRVEKESMSRMQVMIMGEMPKVDGRVVSRKSSKTE